MLSLRHWQRWSSRLVSSRVLSASAFCLKNESPNVLRRTMSSLYADLSSYSNFEQCRLERDHEATGLGSHGNQIYKLTVLSSQRDAAALVKRKKITSLLLDQSGKVLSSGFPGELSVVLSSISPSGEYLGLIRKVEKDDKPKHFLEIWKKTTVLVSMETTDHHDDVYADDFFGTFSWSRDETQVAYIAEVKEPKDKKDGSQEGEKLANNTSKFEYKETWGEAYGKKGRPTIIHVNIQSKTVTSLAGKIEGNPGQVIFSADGSKFIFTNARPEVERLGVIYCTNRNTSVQFCDLSGDNLGTIIERTGSARGLRVSPSGERLVFLSNSLHGPHNSGSSLHEFCWKTQTLRTSVETVSKPAPGGFPGIYLTSLPANCWVSETQLVCSSAWRSSTAVLLINVATGEVTNITPPETVASKGLWTVFDVIDDAILLNHTAPNKPNNLVLGNISRKRKRSDASEGLVTPDNLAWHPVLRNEKPLLADLPRYSEISKIKFKILDFAERPDVEAILMESPSRQGSQEPSPLIVIPHGGPHGVFVPEFFVSQAAFLLSGYSCLLVNYRGSTGFGEAALRSLPGNIGTQEIEEVHYAAQWVTREMRFDPKRVFLHGGSHGGFTVGNLIGQYPGVYAAAVMRNPVTNIASMVDGTDIVDWCYYEAGISDDVSLPTEASNQKMWQCSPIAHVSKVVTPTLILVGDDDKRVPPYQGRSYHNALRRLGVKTRLIVYPGECHPLTGMEAEQDGIKAALGFYAEH